MMGKSKGAGDDNDGLEITAIGSVYKGSWEKKYWSCSRGKYRHPYPIGYQAIRNLAGQMYKMEIQEGDKGPVFVVISEEGITCSGDTPTMAWEKIQMKKALRFQKRHRSQFSRVDGPELFGFANSLVQRLFRELLANGNETTKESDTDIHQHEATLVSSFGQLPVVRTEGSTGEKCLKLVKKKSVRTSCLESPEMNEDCGGPAASIQNDNVINQCCPDLLKETNVNFNGLMNNKEGTTYGHMLPDLLDYLREVGRPHSEHEETLETCINNQEVNVGNQNLAVDLGKDTVAGFQLETSCTNPFTVKDELEADSMPASVQVAKDMLDETKDNALLKDRKYNKTNCLAIVTPLEANSETPLIESVISKECNFSPLQKVTQYSATQSSDGNIDKGDSDSMGQELAKSMMLVLLPQALPLFRHTDKKRKKIKLCEGGDFSSLAKHDHVNLVDELHTERKDSKTFSSEMHVVSNHQICEDTHIDSGLSFGIAVTDCGLGVESQTLRAEDSIEECTYCDMSMPRASNVLQVSKVGRANLEEADIEQKLYKSKSCESTDKDCPVIEFVVPDSFEDEECLIDSLKRNSYVAEQQASFQSHDLTVVNMEADPEALSKPSVILEEVSDVHKFGCSTDNMLLFNCHGSFDKKSTAEENLHLSSCGKCTNKECSYKLSTSWADCNLNVSPILFKEKPDFRVPEETPGLSIGASHRKQTQNSDKISDTHGVFPSVGNLELYAHMTMDGANHQGVDCFGNVITGETDSISYEEFKSASCGESIWIDSLSTELKGFCPVSTFSDTSPCIAKPRTVMNINYCEGVCPNQGVHINAQQRTYENTCDIWSTELVGCYEHSIPVISMVLSVLGVDMHLCVVCGVTQERQRSLFIYKVVVGDASDNCSWLVGYAAAILPDEEYYFDTKYTLDKYGMQITPGGENLILLESIKVQNMREAQINCLQSQCLSQGQCDGHGVKLISVKDSHVSVSAVLSSTERMYCILVSASQSIIAAGENGTVHVWNMDTGWSKCLEEFVLASPDHTSSIWELLAVPCLSHLIICHDCSGCYVMWDVSRRVMLSNFCSVDYNIFQSIALGYVTPNGQHNMGWSFTDHELLDMAKNCKDSKDNMVSKEEEESRTGNKFPPSHTDFCEETAAVCLLVLAAPYKDELERNQDQHYDGLKQRGLWRFALLKNNVLLVGSIFDKSASVVSMLSQSGVIGTSEGYIYIWDALTGRKIFASRDFEGVHITCISQNQMPGAFAVAGSNNRVLLYMQVLRPSNRYSFTCKCLQHST